MSSFEEDISTASFAAFAIAGELEDTDITVIIDRNVEIVDSEGNVRFFGALVHVLKSEIPEWTSGALLETGDGNFRLRQVVADDGYIQKIDASPASA